MVSAGVFRWEILAFEEGPWAPVVLTSVSGNAGVGPVVLTLGP